MPQAIPFIVIGASLLSAAGSIKAGQDANKAAKFQAKQQETQASQVEGAATRAAGEEERRARILQSNLVARAAASGAGAGDPTVLNLEGDIAAEGRYRALSQIYEGGSQADRIRAGASATRYEGKTAQTAGYIQGASTVFSAVGSGLAGKYGGGGFGGSSPNPLSEGEVWASNNGYAYR